MKLAIPDNDTGNLFRQAINRRVIEHYRVHKLKTDADVRTLIRAFPGLVVPDQVNCGKNHSTPFRFVADMLLWRVLQALLYANRGGSKTFLTGWISWVRSSFQHYLETNIVSGSAEQADKSYQAMNSFWHSTHLQPHYLLGSPMLSRTRWKNNSVVSILTASQKSVRGPHPQALVADEIDEMDPDIFEAAAQQPQSKYGIPASFIGTSTKHRVGGMMTTALERMELNPRGKVYKWCIWECLESCRDYDCSTCPLAPYCPGKHMKQAAGYYKIADFIDKLYMISDQTLKVEWFCEEPSREGLVYGQQFDPDIHIINRPFTKLLPVYLSFDWGGSNPFSVGVWQQFDDIGWVRVDEIYQGNTTNQEILKEAKSRPWWNSGDRGVADPARSDLIREWNSTHWNIQGGNNDVDPGIEAVRDCLKPVMGEPRLHVHRDCRDWIREIDQYELDSKGKPRKEHDHAMDDTRYFVRWKVKPVSGTPTAGAVHAEPDRYADF